MSDFSQDAGGGVATEAGTVVGDRGITPSRPLEPLESRGLQAPSPVTARLASLPAAREVHPPDPQSFGLVMDDETIEAIAWETFGPLFDDWKRPAA